MKNKDLCKMLLELMFEEKDITQKADSIPEYFNRYSIIRTYSAGVWFGKITAREGNKIKVEEGRRMYYWFCNKSISLSGCALYGINKSKSKIISPIKSVWIEDIEILECSQEAIETLINAPFVEQE